MALGGAMVLPAVVDLISHTGRGLDFLGTASVTFFVGVCLQLAYRHANTSLSIQQGFLLTALTWIVLTAFAALPFVFCDLQLSYTDAFFEAMSGLTTTGATVIIGLDNAQPGILLWRAILQWLGGIGIIVTAVAILPMLSVGGMHLFRMESSDTSEKIVPRIRHVVAVMGIAYGILSALCAVSYFLAGMPAFDSIAHAMTTVATGGFSTSDHSLAVFDSAAIDTVAIVFMIAGSLPFVLYAQAFGGAPLNILKDTQVRWFFMLVILITLPLALYQWAGDGTSFGGTLREATFTTVSLITGTGYVNTDYTTWSSFAVTLLFLITLIGGCAGSTSCGIKIFRFVVIFRHTAAQLKRLLYPHGLFPPRYNGRPIAQRVSASVMNFIFFYIATLAVIASLLNLMGHDFLTAFSATAATLSNVGPGLGELVGPVGTFGPLSDGAKWLLCFAMLIGRLEIFTVLVLFTPIFWRR